jgi:hypothetical protein
VEMQFEKETKECQNNSIDFCIQLSVNEQLLVRPFNLSWCVMDIWTSVDGIFNSLGF